MFSIFGRNKPKASVELVIPAPTEKHYVLTEEQEKTFSELPRDENGFVRIGDITHGLLNQQSQYIAEYMEGVREGTPVLTNGLRTNIESSSHHSYTIHIDDVKEFVARVKAWRNR